MKLDAGNENVYIIQFNTPSSRNLMPLSAGLLYSYAITNEKIRQRFKFQIEIMRDPPELAAKKYERPAIFSYSLYFWNLNQSMLSAKAAKARFPNVPILVGGPSAPLHEYDTVAFFKEHPYVDAAVAGEGEIVFTDILLALAEGKGFAEVPGVSYRSETGDVVYRPKREYIRDVSVLPSPFLNGTFDELIARYKEHMTGVVWETNRGCPFTCSFCFWGGPDSKISQFSMDRVYAELDWIANNKIAYIFGADANFGILKRDLDIAKYMADLNRRTGYPKFFVINWTKNSTEKIFEIVDALKESEVKFMMTTSVQSHNPETLKAIKRQNIRLESFNKILHEAHRRNFATYSELILGLPLETYKTFINGIRKVLSPTLHYHFNVYQCVLIPGTEMSEPEYVEKYQIQTRKCVMNLGRTVHEGDSVPEYENIVVSTSTMPIQDWKRSHTFAYITKALYGFRPAFFILNYLKDAYSVDAVEFIEFLVAQAESDPSSYKTVAHALALLNGLQESILSGEGNETIKMNGVLTSLYPETAAMIAVLSNKESFYTSLHGAIRVFLAKRDIDIEIDTIYHQVVAYQFAMIPAWNRVNRHVLRFNHDIHNYFHFPAGEEPGRPIERAHTLVIGDDSTYSGIDEFLQKQIYGGMVFSLLKATPLERESKPVIEVRNLFNQIVGRRSPRERSEVREKEMLV